MEFPTRRHFHHDGLRLAYHLSGPEGGPLVVLLHGWPELSYSWAHQIPAIAAAGYRVVAPDLRGFGGSDAPHGLGHYAIAQMVGDVEALIDHLGADTATVIGHDWGGIIAWQAALMLGDPAVVAGGRVSRVASICTPLVREAPVDPLAIFERRFGPDHYFLVFNREPDATAALFARDPDAFFATMMRTVPKDYEMGSAFTYIPRNFAAHLASGRGVPKGQILSGADRAVYAEGYRASGFHGGIALYRNTTENWELTRGLRLRVTQPALMVSPEDDRLLPPSATDHMPELVDDLTRVTIPDCGHWAMWERPDAVNRVLVEWLG